MNVSSFAFPRNSLIQLRPCGSSIVCFQNGNFLGRWSELRINFKLVGVFIIVLLLILCMFRKCSSSAFGHSLRGVICVGNTPRHLSWVITVSSSWRCLFKQLSCTPTLLLEQFGSSNFLILKRVLTLGNVSEASRLILLYVAHSMPNTEGLRFSVVRLNLNLVLFLFFPLYFFFQLQNSCQFKFLPWTDVHIC